jgi:uncharacterized protein (UPF0332 family)
MTQPEAAARCALSRRRLDRAHQHLKAAGDLLANEDYADSVSRSYYAIFQAARAVLAIEGLESRKHSGIVALFNRHFVKPGRVDKLLGTLLKDARRSRERADYDELADFSRDDAEAQLCDAEEFLRVAGKVLSQTVAEESDHPV